jgi:hypothetical protein
MNKKEKEKIQEMNASEALEGIEGNLGDASNKIDLVMAANTKESKKITTITMSHVLTVMTSQKRCSNNAQH